MDAIRAAKIEEFDQIRLTVPLKGSNVFDDSEIHTLPVGSEGTVVHVFPSRDAWEVEFLLFTDPSDQEYFISIQIPVEADQCEPVYEK